MSRRDQRAPPAASEAAEDEGEGEVDTLPPEIIALDQCTEPQLQQLLQVVKRAFKSRRGTRVEDIATYSRPMLEFLRHANFKLIASTLVSQIRQKKGRIRVIDLIMARIHADLYWIQVEPAAKDELVGEGDMLVPEVIPDVRSVFASCVVQDRFLFIHGGITGQVGPEHVYIFDAKQRRWTKFVTEGTRQQFRKRWSHSMVCLKKKRVYMFGGVDAGYFFGDLHCLDTDTATWSDVKVDQRHQIHFRHGASMTGYRDRFIVVFGGATAGEGGYGFLNDLNVLDVDEPFTRKRWVKKPLDGPVIPARAHHSAAVTNGNQLYIFGGWNRTEVFNDVHVVNLSTYQVTRVFDTGIRPPCVSGLGRRGYTICPGSGMMAPYRDGRKLFVWGGYAGGDERYSTDLYCFDVGTATWTRLTTANQPGVRAMNCLQFVGDELVMFAGNTLNGKINETWICKVSFAEEGDAFRRGLHEKTTSGSDGPYVDCVVECGGGGK